MSKGIFGNFNFPEELFGPPAGKEPADKKANSSGKGGGKRPPIFEFPADFGFKRPKFGPFIITVGILAALFMGIWLASQIWTEVLWYEQLGFLQVLLTHWLASGILFVASFGLALVVLLANMRFAYRQRPQLSTLSGVGKANALLFEKSSKRIIRVVPLLAALFVCLQYSLDWRQFLLAIYGGDFGIKDPQFGLDISFFIFRLPLYSLMLGYILLLLGATLIICLVLYYLAGNIQLVTKVKVTQGARIHLGVLLFLISLVVAASHFLGRYEMVYATGARTSGAMYTDVNAVIPAKTILAAIGIIIAILFLVAAFRDGWHLPIAAIAVTVVAYMVIGVGYPMLIQKFRVDPNERDFEKPYIERNIKATLSAFGMENLEYSSYSSVTTEAKAQQLRKDADSTQQIRLLDPDVISPAVRQMKQSRPYYSFPDQFAVDRYTFDVNGKKETRDTVIAVRDINLDGLAKSQRNWVNDHTVYTHGFGVVAAYGNQVGAEGLPAYWESSLSDQEDGEIGKYEKRVYFSKYSPAYSVVGAPKGSTHKELNYADAKKNDAQVYTTFTGSGGPSIGNPFNKLLYAIKFRSTELFFADQVNSESQILYNRDPALRVAKVAPYLSLDSQVYPAVVDMDGDPKTPKRVVWIIDGYTTSSNYPYSQHVDLTKATADTDTANPGAFSTSENINYMRNSVKAVVDAYDGKVTLYEWDTKDPILKAWQKIYPGQVQPLNKISGDLMSHLRYPEDIFKVQRSLLTNYHVTDPSQFYTGGDQWKLSEDPTAESRGADGASKMQPPYYLTMKMPHQQRAEFSLTSVFIPGGEGKRAAMAGFLAVDSETGNQPGKIRQGYGKMRLISLPSDTTVPGPGQVQNTFNSDPVVNKELNLQDQQGSKVIRGNLLTLPVGGGLLYVQPVYVQSTGTTQFPQLRSVLVAFGDKIGFAPTLKQALDQLFGGDSGAVTAGSDSTQESADKPTDSAPDNNAKAIGETKQPASTGGNNELNKALRDAKTAMEKADKARRDGDWAEYGKAQKDLNAAIEKALKAQSK